MYWLEFLTSAVIIVFAGIRLAVYADKLSRHLKIGQMWVGIVVLGLVTSLPEAITSISSIVSLNAYDLAMGNLLGSNNFNPLLIVVMDLLYRKGSVTDAVQPNDSHKFSALFAIALTFIVIVEMALSSSPHLGPLTIGGILIAWLYFSGMRKLGSLGAREIPVAQHMERPPQVKTSFSKICFNLLIATLMVTVGSMWLAKSANMIANQTGLGGTFVGSIFLALVTSLPEMVVTISALKMGSLDLAIGNIFGSNMSNVFIIFLCSLVKKGDPFFNAVSSTHILTGVLSIVLVSIVLTGIYVKNKRKVFGLGWDSILLLATFSVGTYFLYKLR